MAASFDVKIPFIEKLQVKSSINLLETPLAKATARMVINTAISHLASIEGDATIDENLRRKVSPMRGLIQRKLVESRGNKTQLVALAAKLCLSGSERPGNRYAVRDIDAEYFLAR